MSRPITPTAHATYLDLVTALRTARCDTPAKILEYLELQPYSQSISDLCTRITSLLPPLRRAIPSTDYAIPHILLFALLVGLYFPDVDHLFNRLIAGPDNDGTIRDVLTFLQLDAHTDDLTALVTIVAHSVDTLPYPVVHNEHAAVWFAVLLLILTGLRLAPLWRHSTLPPLLPHPPSDPFA